MPSWFTKRLNGKIADPIALASSIEDLHSRRDHARRRIADRSEQRGQALLDQDFKLAEKLRREITTDEDELDALNRSEPELLERLAAAKFAARQRRFQEIRSAALAQAADVLAAARTTSQKAVGYVALVETARREGYERELGGLPALPLAGGNLLCSGELLDILQAAITAASQGPTTASRTPSQPIRVPRRPPLDRTSDSESLADIGVPTAARLTAERAPDDDGPLNPGEVRVSVVRAGWSPADDRPQCHRGQRIRMAEFVARAAADRGAVEIIEESQPPAPTDIEQRQGEHT